MSGDTRFAISSLFGRLPSQVTARFALCGPSITSATSVMPYQLIAAATLGTGVLPAHCRSSPALSGIIALVSVRCPPADSPVTTMRSTSML